MGMRRKGASGTMENLLGTRTEKGQMLQRARGILNSLGVYALWATLAAFLALALYQLHVTLVFIGLRLVENPATRPAGWNTATITGLSRFIILVLGALWLVSVSLLEGYLREGSEEGRLRKQVVRMLVIVAAIYGISHAVLLLLS
jgi:hypothetical protein